MTPPGIEHGGNVAEAGQGHHHRRQPFVAGGHAQHALGPGDGAGQAAEHGSGVVAVGQRVEHARRALRAPVARVGAMAGVGDAAGAAISSAAAFSARTSSQWPVW